MLARIAGRNVACCDCGLLTVTNDDEDTISHAGQQFRNQGWHSPASFLPHCYVRAHDLRREAEKLSRERLRSSTDDMPRIKYEIAEAITGKERRCSQFTPWLIGKDLDYHLQNMTRSRIVGWTTGLGYKLLSMLL
ncbi:MAG: hypothetical protein KC482_08825 [Dehalococcoidia bacterium]|nr:hypothetical protein [Dehalococcoidia bacterium]